MGDPLRHRYPQTWDEVPLSVYVPTARAQALDEDGVDAEVLFPNDPGSFHQYRDPEYERACVEAYNDALAEWRAATDRFIPLAMVPILGAPGDLAAVARRAAETGHRGVVMLAEPSTLVKGVPHISDPHWYRLWDACQELELAVHVHASGGLGQTLTVPRWSGYDAPQAHSASTIPTAAWPAQLIPNLIFSGITERFPRLNWVFAETGIGSINYVRVGCDHEWERRHLWTEGILTRPSEVVQRQIYVDFWYEVAGLQLRHEIGLDNIMWESDYPHIASTYPDSWAYVERSLHGVPDNERRKLLYENAMRLYKL
jgi:predicted TIM-barrel fold metal-dependent hydrolase